MLQISVRTLDLRDHSFSVPDESTVKEFKDQIAPVLNIPVDKQRLIFCGKVLEDKKKLAEYDVDGKFIHVVQSLPPQGNPRSSSSSTRSNSGGSIHIFRESPDVVFGSLELPEAIRNAFRDYSSYATSSSNSGNSHNRRGPSEVIIGPISIQDANVIPPPQSHVPLSFGTIRMNRVRSMLTDASRTLELIENSTNSNNGIPAEAENSPEARNSPEAANSSAAEVRNSPEVIRIAECSLSSQTLTNLDTLRGEINLLDASETQNGAEGISLERLAQITLAALAPEVNVSRVPSPRGIQPVDPAVTAMDTLPSDSEPAAREPTQTEREGPNPDTESSCPDCSRASTRPPTANRSDPSNRERLSMQSMAGLFDEVIQVNRRLQPCLERYRDVIRNDSALSGTSLQEAQSLLNRISKLMHFLSHAYHSLSDLHVDFSQPPPRRPRIRMMSPAQDASLLPGIPLPVSSRVPRVRQTIAEILRSSSRNRSPRTQSPAASADVAPGSIAIDLTALTGPCVCCGTSAVLNTPIPPSSQTNGSQSSTTTTTTTTAKSNAENPPASRTETKSNTARSERTRSSLPNLPILNGPRRLPLRNVPLPVPLRTRGAESAFDPGLPCLSVWTLESRRRQIIEESRTSTASARRNLNAASRLSNRLLEIINNMRASVLNPVSTQSDRVHTGVTTRTSNRNGRSREDPGNVNAAAEGGRPMRTRSNRVRSPRFRSRAEEYQYLITNLTDLGMADKKIAESLPNLSLNLNSICGNIMKFLIDTLTYKDVIGIICDQFDSVNEYKDHFAEYIHSNIFQSEQIEEDAYGTIVQQISEEVEACLDSYLANVNIRRGTTFHSAVSCFFGQSVRKFIDAALGKTEDSSSTFGHHLVTTVHTIFREFLNINYLFTVNGSELIREMAMVTIDSSTIGLGRTEQVIIRAMLLSVLSKALYCSPSSHQTPVATRNSRRPPSDGASATDDSDTICFINITSTNTRPQRRRTSNGKPSKRRKTSKSGNPILRQPCPTALSDMVAQAISTADVKPETSIDDVKKEALEDAPLQTSFTEHIREAIQDRLQCDGDYCPEQFPNSEKYFN